MVKRFLPLGKHTQMAMSSRMLWNKFMGDLDRSVEEEKDRMFWLIGSGRVGFKAYHRLYVMTKYWQDISQRRKVLDKHRCVVCGAKKEDGAVLEVHHKRYVFWEEDIEEDLVTLCDGCHEVVDDAEALSLAMKKISVDLESQIWSAVE